MPKRHSYILGINAYDHDVSACLLRDGAIAFAIAKERINRHKHATGFYQEVVDYCLRAAAIGFADLEGRGLYEKRLKFERILETYLGMLIFAQGSARAPIYTIF